MWCRTILTAIAISCTFTREIIVRAHGQDPQRLVQIKDVVCMLLWSGLQKEDVDPSTLEKLARYNVNIDGMNNQKLLEECLVPHATTEVQREILKTSTPKERNENYVTVGIYPKLGMLLAENFEDRTVVQHEAKINVTNNVDQIPVIDLGIPDIGNATQVLDNKGILKIEYNMQNQPNVQSVLKFWTKLTRFNTTVVTTPPTATVAPITTTGQTHETKNITANENDNNGYVHSREMEYINRILAEYLASQSVPTTTQRISTKNAFPNTFPKKYWEVLRKASVEEEPNRVNEQKEINTINNVTEDDLHMIQETLDRQIQKNEPKVIKPKSDKTNKTIGILQRLLQMMNDLFNNGVIIPKPESNSETIKSNKSKENQDETVSFNLFKLFQNMEVNKNLFKNDQSTSATKSRITAETWRPVPLSNENLITELKTSPVENKESNQEQMFHPFKITPSQIIKPERTKIYHDDDRVKDTKKSRLHQNSDVEDNKSRFQAMLQSVEYSKQNKSEETSNSQVQEMSEEMDKPHQNENVPLFRGKKAVISQPATKENFDRNQLFKMKNDLFNADSGDIEQKTKKIKAILEIINNFDRDNEQLTSHNVRDTKATLNVDSMNMSDVQAIPSHIIKQIVENVKRMVLKEIGVNINTTAVGTTSTPVAPTTIFSTSMSTTVSKSEKPSISLEKPSTSLEKPSTSLEKPSTSLEKPSTSLEKPSTSLEKPSTSLQNEFAQTRHVMKELMEIFKEMKAMKDTLKLANQLPQNTSIVSDGAKNLPQLPIQPYPETPSKNPYLMENPSVFKPSQTNSDPRIVKVPISFAGNPPQNMAPQFIPPPNVQPTKDYHFGAITIQTNSHEIAPLAIEISKPLNSVNQNYVVTKQMVDQLRLERERDSAKYIDDKLRIPNEDTNLRGKLESDLLKHVRFAEKHEFRDQHFRGRYLDREKPWYNHEYREKVHNMENTPPVKSRFPELHYPGKLSLLEHSRLPKDLSYSENLSHPRGHSRPGFNEPGYQQNGLGREHRLGSYGNSDYDRHPPYKATKFHEKLERVDNWPQSAWKDFHSPSESSNDEISAREQLPLVKVKQRKRYDDTHFNNFLKSQQKVTDMLEKLLANSVKNRSPHSVETP